MRPCVHVATPSLEGYNLVMYIRKVPLDFLSLGLLTAHRIEVGR